MGFSFNGQCYETASTLVEAFMARFPSFDGPVVTWLNSVSLSGSSLTFSLQVRYLDSNVINTRVGTVTVPSCTFVPDNLTLVDVFALPSTAEGAAAWAAGFVMPFAIALLAWGIRQMFDVVSIHQ